MSKAEQQQNTVESALAQIEEEAEEEAIALVKTFKQACKTTANDLRKSKVCRFKFTASIFVLLLNISVLALAIYEVTVNYSIVKLLQVIFNCAALSTVTLIHILPTYFFDKLPTNQPQSCDTGFCN